MKGMTSSLVVLLLLGCTTVSAQSLVDAAKKEKERRSKLQGQAEGKPAESSNRNHAAKEVARDRTPLTANGEPSQQKNDVATVQQDPTSPTIEDSEVSISGSSAPEDKGPNENSLMANGTQNRESAAVKSSPGGGKARDNGPPLPEESARATEPADGPSGVTVSSPTKGTTVQIRDELAPPTTPPSKDLRLRGALYIDWFRMSFGDDASSGQLSSRVKLEAGQPPGDGWRARLDVRNRLNHGARSSNQLIVYDAYMMLDDKNKPFSLSFGQMNLYDSAGIGVLLGGLLGYRIGDALTVGGYGGLEPNLYGYSVDAGYQKFGAFARYDGVDARSLTVSYNTIRFAGQTERRFLYTSGLIPLDRLVLYGNLEYELGSNITGEDRVSRVFMNARFNVTDTVDITGNYSSGKGLDYHRFLLEQSQSFNVASAELERFYYSEQYGIRLGYRFHPQMRVFVEQRRSEQKDRLIVNNTTRLGGSAYDIAGSGFSLYGSYNINRGDASESNSLQFSASRDFGRLSWTGYFSTSFNGIRFDAVSGRPVIIHIDNRRTFSNDFFYVLTRALALSLEYEYSVLGEDSENTIFARAIYRF